ncbi:MAG: archaeosortase/exosortase family protein [Bacteroidota bacterium]|nr:MAG: archaeosortase/exosortase family protein [Bacteroidota bacterium]
MIEKIRHWIDKRSKLDLFLLKAGMLLMAYYLARMAFAQIPFLYEFAKAVRRTYARFLAEASAWLLDVAGYNAQSVNRIVWIEGSQGVKVINACLGWSVMALFAGFVLIYPGIRKTKYWFIPMGILLVIAANLIRITAMAWLSFEASHLLDFYHHYVFNLILYLVVFSLWFLWIRWYGQKT